MNETLNKVLWAAGTALVAVLLVLAIIGGGSPTKGYGTVAAGITNLTGLSIDGNSPGTLTVAGATTLTGSVTMTSATTTQNGVTTVTLRQSMTSGTTTPCSIPIPMASSTIQSWAANFTSATSSALNWSVGTSTTAFATTSTMLAVGGVGANTQKALSWDAGVNNADANLGIFIVIGTTVGSPAAAFTNGNGPVVAGTCQAVFQSYI